MKSSAFPMRLELEVKVASEWEIMFSYAITNHKQLYDKVAHIKSLYNLSEKDWRLIFILNSKVNKFLE